MRCQRRFRVSHLLWAEAAWRCRARSGGRSRRFWQIVEHSSVIRMIDYGNSRAAGFAYPADAREGWSAATCRILQVSLGKH